MIREFAAFPWQYGVIGRASAVTGGGFIVVASIVFWMARNILNGRDRRQEVGS